MSDGAEGGTACQNPGPKPDSPGSSAACRTTRPSPGSDSPNGQPDSLDSLSARERRDALGRLVARGLTDRDVPMVSQLLSDPEREIRALAVTALLQRPGKVDVDVVRRALRDPSDEVRAGAVRLAASLPRPDLALLASLVGARRWPLTQRTALEVQQVGEDARRNENRGWR